MFEDAQQIAREAGALAVEYFRRLATVTVESKGHLDLVTEADREVESFIVRRLLEAYPEDGVFGEEGAASQTRSGRIWIIDPIDGTFNFVRGGDRWAVSIGLYEDRRPRFGVLCAPIRNQFLVGGDGVEATLNGKPMAKRSGLDRSRAACSVGLHPSITIDEQLALLRFILEDAGMTFRNTGSATTDLIAVANGEVDGYVGLGISTWDVMAILPVLEELGVTTTLDWRSIEPTQKLRFVCGTSEFLEVFASVALAQSSG